MRVIDAGHKFALAHLDGDGETVVTYVKREGDKFPGNVGHHEGTNLQECWRAEIECMKYLDMQDPCTENRRVIHNLRENIMMLEERAARRHGRRPDWRLYEKNGDVNDQIEYLPVCAHCGHIGCLKEGEQTKPVVPPVRRSCNRHDDCEQAEKDRLSRYPGTTAPPNFHCHNDECEECFGN